VNPYLIGVLIFGGTFICVLLARIADKLDTIIHILRVQDERLLGIQKGEKPRL
jgi:hypothetical protein